MLSISTEVFDIGGIRGTTHCPVIPLGIATCMEYEGMSFFLLDRDTLKTALAFYKYRMRNRKARVKLFRLYLRITTESRIMESIMARMRKIRLFPVLKAATAMRSVASRNLLPSLVGLI